MFQLVIDNPWVFVLAALIGLITGWWIWGRASASGINTGIGGVAAGVGGAVGGVASGVTNTATGAAGAVGDVASGAVGKVGDVASGAADTAKGAAGAAAGAAKGAVDKAGDVASSAADTAKGAAGAATKTAKGAAGKASAAASGAKKKVTNAAGKPKIAAAVGKPDDLTKIKGVGPKLNELCHSLGVKRFDQIAKWTKADVAEVDQYLKIKGRIDRDKWVAQATLLAKGDDAGHKAKFG